MLLGAKSAAVDWLVVGLGNPGAKYEHTRHNMGFLTVDLLAEQAGVKLNKVKFKSAYNIIPFAGAKCLVMNLTVDLLAEQAGVKLNKVKFKSAYNIIPFAGAKCLVMKPQTYMNLSGEAVREAVQFYKIPADHVLVIYDDVSLPVGKLRVRPTGSAGGHNGIKNIIAHLGTQDFPRIKIGTGAPGEGGDMIDWVIGVPSQAERKVLVESFRRAIDAATQDFPRIKIGTGAPGEGGDMIDWVIGVPSQAERKVLVESFRRAIDAAECIIEHGCQKAMNDFN